MDAIEELYELSDSMRQASALLADEDVDENSSSSSKRQTTFLNVVALGNTVSLDSTTVSSIDSVICLIDLTCRSLDLSAFGD
ncbi:hypothetical protein C3L33_21310, partial [Rhododendron williamsianum]